MKRGLILILLVLTGCAESHLRTPGTDPEENAALAAHATCLWEAAKSLDDGSSDATSIGLAIVPACARSFQQLTDAVTRGMGPDAKLTHIRALQSERLAVATSTVVRVRAAARSRATPKP